MLIDMRVEQMVGLKRLDQVIASVVASKPETQVLFCLRDSDIC